MAASGIDALDHAVEVVLGQAVEQADLHVDDDQRVARTC